MIKSGLVFILISVLMYVAAVISPFISEHYFLVLLPSAVTLALIGSLLILIAVIKDRMKEKEEEDDDDLSQY